MKNRFVVIRVILFAVLSVGLTLGLGWLMMMTNAGCAGIQSNRRITDHKAQTSSTRITAGPGATIYSITFQSLKETNTIAWIGLFSLSMAGWARAWFHGRRGRLGGTRLIDVLNEAMDAKNNEVVNTSWLLAQEIKSRGRDRLGEHDATEKWIRSLVKQNRRCRRDKISGVGFRWPLVTFGGRTALRWPWGSKTGGGD